MFDQVGYWMTVSTGTRSICLTLLLPREYILVLTRYPGFVMPLVTVIINFYRSRETAQYRPIPEDDTVSSTPPTNPDDDSQPPPRAMTASDLAIARTSLALESLGFLFQALAFNSLLFTGATALGALGSGFQPVMQSLVLALHGARTESTDVNGSGSGSVFGALSLVQALASQVLGPALYGTLYASTVGTFPAAIFVATAVCFAVSFLLVHRIASRHSIQSEVREHP
jgi:hypothetical protein